jgi:hypothetical protein
VRTVQRAAAFCALGLFLAESAGAGAGSGRGVTMADFALSQILVGPPFVDHVQGRVAADRTLTVYIDVTAIDDPAAQAGQVDITVDLSEVASRVDVVGLTTDCDIQTTDTALCHIQLPDLPPPVPVPQEAIGLRASAGAPTGSAGTIYLSWEFNGTAAPTMATIDAVVIPVQTATPPATTIPQATAAAPATTLPPARPAVIRTAPARTTAEQSPTPTPTPEVTMTPDPTPGGDPLAGGPPALIPLAGPPAGGSAWRSPAVVLSLGTAAVGLLVAMAYAAISMRRAGRD